MPRRFVGILEVDLVFGQRNLIGDPEKPALRFVVLVETRERVVIVTLDGNPASFVQKHLPLRVIGQLRKIVG